MAEYFIDGHLTIKASESGKTLSNNGEELRMQVERMVLALVIFAAKLVSGTAFDIRR